MTTGDFWRRFRSAQCPTGWKLGQAASQGLTAAQTTHVESCAHCASELRALEQLGRRARTLTAPIIPAASRTRIVMALRSEASGPRRRALSMGRPWRWSAAAALALTIGAGTLLASLYHGTRNPPAPAASASHASVRVIGQAAYDRAQTGGDEIIRLESGTIDLEVKPLAPTERLRVMVGDATVEVRGTHFDITAAGNRLQSVHVHHGVVDVSIGDKRVTRLGEGDQWLASPPTPVAPSLVATDAPKRAPQKPALVTPPEAASRPPIQPSSRRASARWPVVASAAPPPPAPTIAAADRAAFQQGWMLLRQGDFMAAAAAFADLERRVPGDAIVEDALFWRGVALGRAGQRQQARAAIASFVSRFPQSARAGEASASLGWLLVEAGDRVGARSLFERAARDRSDRVRASARNGLQQIEAAEDAPADGREAAAASR
ncbi:MAG TPA: tetratricopeptide repeat protein [Polyangia bacterium]|jgi:TolA-binding protein|nr:tetratricopeptide repeat protein [Polyangia bacterium]